ncbi:MAG: T9SS type A sorting domain-containing protein [Bacteroidia bacterium]|nr:T9SS type A sorting domain-containing protein [Bacteroidia bacterium]
MTSRGGVNDFGVIYGYTKIFDFDGAIGHSPVGRLIELPDGFLYGTTKFYSSGKIFKIRLDGSDFTTLKDFDFNQGHPVGDIVLGSDGNFYGVTSSDQDNPKGLLYKINPSGANFSVLVDFSIYENTTGSKPCGIRQNSNGDLIGVSTSGGQNFGGTIFKVKTDGTGLVKLKDLDYSYLNVVSKNVPLEASSGKLYGTNFLGPYLYSINSDGSNYVEYSFPVNSQLLIGNLIELPDKEIYGVHFGNIFRYNINSGEITNLLPGNGIYKPDFGESFHFAGLLAVEKLSQTITFNPLPSVIVDSAPFTIGTSIAFASSGLPLSFSSSNTSVATISGSTITIVGAGSTTITAKQAGNANFNSATDVPQVLTVSKASQVIAFASLTAKTFGDASFNLSAIASSGLTVSYASSDQSIATISGNSVSIMSGGTVTITVSQAGNENYNSAAVVTQLLTVNKANQTITFNSVATKIFGEGPFNLTATTSSGLGIQFSTTSDKVSLSGNQVTLVKPGSVAIKADQTGNSNFNEALSVSQSFCINPVKPTITSTGLSSGTPVLTSSSASGNQWFKNGTLIADEVSNTYSPTDGGSYSVKVTVDNCASEISTEQLLVITGDIKSASNDGFFVYPNPTSNTLTINLKAFDASSEVGIVVYNLSGKVMDQISKHGDKVTISVGSYSVGTYFIKASQRNRTFVTKFEKE